MRRDPTFVRQALLFDRGQREVGRLTWESWKRGRAPRQRESVITGTHLVVIPRVPVRIRQSGGDVDNTFVADTRSAVFYNRGQAYAAEQIVDEGEDSIFFSLDDGSVRDCARAFRLPRRRADERERPLPFSHGPCDARSFALQQQICSYLTGDHVDPIAAEEAIVILTSHLLELGFRARGARQGDALPLRRQRDAAEAARLILLRRFREPLRLGGIANAVGLSSYHLCRIFRRHIGTSLHQYRADARLRASLQLLCERDIDLALLALDLGFSSQAHFTSAFSARFGCSPARFRRAARDGSPPQAITILKDSHPPD